MAEVEGGDQRSGVRGVPARAREAAVRALAEPLALPAEVLASVDGATVNAVARLAHQPSQRSTEVAAVIVELAVGTALHPGRLVAHVVAEAREQMASAGNRGRERRDPFPRDGQLPCRTMRKRCEQAIGVFQTAPVLCEESSQGAAEPVGVLVNGPDAGIERGSRAQARGDRVLSAA